jgi:serine phosphatase RsbU (regulator of sigma subunit)
MPYSNPSLLPELFSQSFLYHISKESLSGDFCWIEQFEDRIFIAAADCKEHGVRGAMMSMICASTLNRVLHEFNVSDTGKMLDKAKELLMDIFKNSKSGKQYEINISLCCINKHTCVLEWSGANNNLFYVHNGIMEEMMGNKYPVGNLDGSFLFTKHKMYLSKGDMIYLFTDGFTNQIGGEQKEKLMCKCFQDMLIKIAPLEAQTQKDILEGKFKAWKGDSEQTDDVLLIGVRL